MDLRLILILLLLLSGQALAQRNKPVITGQKPLSTNENTPLTLQLTDFEVTDPDNWFYPWGFTLKIHKGDNYNFSETTITPKNGFVGVLHVKVTVNDGRNNSDPFMAEVTVNPVNTVPVITGQTQLQTTINTSITIRLTHLTVSDDDNTYPDDFTLQVSPGQNYSIHGETITPSKDFKGTLSVNVSVNDGIATSAPYKLKIEVTDVLTITGQTAVTISEEQPTTLGLSHLVVRDPNGIYPSGYSLHILAGENYSVEGTTVSPADNFTGQLQVKLNVSNGTTTSNNYPFIITVNPANDAPEIVDLETTPLRYSVGNEPVHVSELLRVTDPDDKQIVLAEIGFSGGAFQPGGDQLLFTNTAEIRGVFDPQAGILSLIGVASLEAYQNALRSVQYSFNPEGNLLGDTKTLYFKLNDGKNVSGIYERVITMREIIELDIPTVFTPNSDQANDTWVIVPAKKSDRLNQAIIRVYNRRGALVYQTTGFDQPWDGQYKGSVLPADVYYYTIDLNMSTTSSSFSGTVTLLH